MISPEIESSPYEVVINRGHPIQDAETYVPQNLVPVRGSEQMMEAEAAAALERMLDALEADGHTVIVASGYRSYQRQAANYQRKIETMRVQNPEYSDEEAAAKAAEIVAVPGTSEHQLGLAVDLSTDYTLDDHFAETEVGKWCLERCTEFGFIHRYPPGATEITGIIWEPWHFRYVGVEAAKEIAASGLCMEQYYEVPLDGAADGATYVKVKL